MTRHPAHLLDQTQGWAVSQSTQKVEHCVVARCIPDAPSRSASRLAGRSTGCARSSPTCSHLKLKMPELEHVSAGQVADQAGPEVQRGQRRNSCRKFMPFSPSQAQSAMSSCVIYQLLWPRWFSATCCQRAANRALAGRGAVAKQTAEYESVAGAAPHGERYPRAPYAATCSWAPNVLQAPSWRSRTGLSIKGHLK